ncbi:hypothetical protein C6P40_001635 [Pichia californica]|uniref:Micro-fibrillar-associated protein 1 C-terminal domain-containing protein n=1 Tax=Pichia californica TaxID=460514 RepID=A0A9P7BHI2_9ASCO|nr:hypothetical protein C6P42_000032 [[Candida] californica]KAG0691351.1 hypothetical protein C6P40_001635 [[Candida] californica]
MSSDSDSGSSSESDSSTFQKKVVFKKTLKKKIEVNNTKSKLQDLAVSNINKNLKRLEQEDIHQKLQSSLVIDERILYNGTDDTDIPNDESEYLAWKRRELNRLHRDRNRRIQREESNNI